MSKGFTLLELMIVVAIVACLSILSVPRLMKSLAKAKRTEAYIFLRTIAQAQRVYYAEHGRYARSLKEAGWEPEGSYNYTYGVPGSVEEEGCFRGAYGVPSSSLQGHIDDTTFIISAAGNIYGNKIDILTINEKGIIKLQEDGLT